MNLIGGLAMRRMLLSAEQWLHVPRRRISEPSTPTRVASGSPHLSQWTWSVLMRLTVARRLAP